MAIAQLFAYAYQHGHWLCDDIRGSLRTVDIINFGNKTPECHRVRGRPGDEPSVVGSLGAIT